MAEHEPEPEPEPELIMDEARYAELAEKHVYGDRKRRPTGRASWFRISSDSALGIEIAVAIAGTTLLARWLETNYTHWSPWTTVIGLMVGLGAATKALIRTARRYQKDVAKLQHEQSEAAGDAVPDAVRDAPGESSEPGADGD